MDKKTLLAIVISLLILIGYQFLFAPTPVPVSDNSTINKSETQPVDNHAQQAPQDVQIVTNKPSVSKNIQLLPISNNFLTIFFDKNTGDIHRVSITNYKNKKLPTVTFKTEQGNYLQVLNGIADNFSVDIKEENNVKVVIFTSLKNNIGVTKTYVINKDSYLVKLHVKVSNYSDQTLRFAGNILIGPGLGEGFEKASYIFEGAILYNDQKKEEVNYTKVKETVELKNPKWVGYTSKYYLFSLIDGHIDSAQIEKLSDSALIKSTKEFLLNPKSSSDTTFTLFIGPKEYDLLKSYKLGLEHSIDFGWFKFLAVPMLKFMIYIYDFTKNYGVAIIILTIVVKLLTYPLTIKSMASMKKMQAIQPKLMELRVKFKNEPQKLNAAMMELYRKHGVNPMSGCLPMLIQIPIFFALYKALLVSVELKGSPFIFWITDLSAKDPYYITPIIMGITMFIQQKMTPSTMDPLQQKLFLFMPIIFTFLFLNFPSGLVIYWLTNNILSIAQQYYINKKIS